jgi:hypothetical protein
MAHGYERLLKDTSDSVDSKIRNHALNCLTAPACFIWAAMYHNISTIMYDLEMEKYRHKEGWTDENNRPLLCELEYCVIRTIDPAILVKKRSPLFDVMDNVVGRIMEGGIFMQIKKRNFMQENVQS